MTKSYRIIALAVTAIAILASALGAQAKTGILLVHYGTNNDARRHITIDRLDSLTAAAFPQHEVMEAYAAPAVVKALAKRGIHKLNISQALDSLKAHGCTRVAVQSTMLLDGTMSELIKDAVKQAAPGFEKIEVGRPMLYSVDDCRRVVATIAANLSADKSLPTNAQVVLVGHGSDNPANAMYSQIDYLLKAEGKSHWHVGTIEGYPTIDNVKQQLAKNKQRRVIMVPLLYIAGNHLNDDVDGVWRKQLEADGYKVWLVGKGLGEMPEVQNLIIENINNLTNKL